MSIIEHINDRFEQLQRGNGHGSLQPLQQSALEMFRQQGVPTVKNEEWKYTRIGSVLNRDFNFSTGQTVTPQDLDTVKLPGNEVANELVFVNGVYQPSLSVVRSSGLKIMPLNEAAASEYANIVTEHLGSSNRYVRDGIQAMNTAFVQEGLFLYVGKGIVVEHPVYIYHVTDTRGASMVALPRLLMYVGEHAQVQIAENHATLGQGESFTNEVLEVVVEKDAIVEYYKIQNDAPASSQVCTILFQQKGKCFVHAVTVSLGGGIVRNNCHIAMAAAHSEANMYGLYFLKGQSHVDNHTVVDNIQPGCLSNELYKGIIDESGTAVFNGKIYVQPQAQKTNAFQSNKNILLSDKASVNTKPQLEIFADDVKCSHGCTVGRLDEEGMFYLRSRGITEQTAKSLLIHAFAIDILEHIRLKPVSDYVDGLISDRLQLN